MWVVAFFGAATAYIESTNAQIYKEEHDGKYHGGPAYYIEKAMGQKWYAWTFAIATIIATGILLPTVQSNTIGTAIEQVFSNSGNIDTVIGVISYAKLYTAIGIVILLGFIIFGGIRRIANFTQVVVPFMALAYILISLIIIGMNITQLPAAFMITSTVAVSTPPSSSVTVTVMVVTP